MDAIKALYTDPKKGFVGQTKLVHKLGATQKKGDLRKFYANADKLQMNQKVRKPDHYLRITGPPYSFQIDVMFLRGNLDLPEKYGDKMLLVLIDILSRKAYIYPVHDNKLPTLIKAYAKFLGDMDEFRDGNKALAASVMRDRDESNAGSLVASVTGDDEFGKAAFQNYNKQRGINCFTSVATDDHRTYGDRLGIINRFTRTFKNMLRMYTDITGDVKYMAQISTLTANYNDTVHSSLSAALGEKRTPAEVFASAALLRKVRLANARHNRAVSLGMRFLPIGTPVRAADPRGLFDKEKYHFSQDVYYVHEHDCNRYRLCGNPSKVPGDHADCYGNQKAPKRRYKITELLPVNVDELIRIGSGDGVYAVEHDRQVLNNNLIRREGWDREQAEAATVAVAADARSGVQTRAKAKAKAAAAAPAPVGRQTRAQAAQAAQAAKGKQKATHAADKGKQKACQCVNCFKMYECDGEVTDSCYCDVCRKKPGFSDQPCVVCGSPDQDAHGPMILCDNCDRGYHARCLNLRSVPRGEWFCSPECEAQKNAGERAVTRVLMRRRLAVKGKAPADYEYLVEWADSEQAVWVPSKVIANSVALKLFAPDPVDAKGSQKKGGAYEAERIVKRTPTKANPVKGADYKYEVKWKYYPDTTQEPYARVRNLEVFRDFSAR